MVVLPMKRDVDNDDVDWWTFACMPHVRAFGERTCMTHMYVKLIMPDL